VRNPDALEMVGADIRYAENRHCWASRMHSIVINLLSLRLKQKFSTMNLSWGSKARSAKRYSYGLLGESVRLTESGIGHHLNP